ncbi:hypothetical protein DBV15_12516 [Temnothorax longispinosus]|uniref:Uncharacterized protein n=1 Tax=Temnothorax longispinosus TaxID=300112 RepID=A0A4S2KKR5_9HYME|nr:hypothetical protein DBV15_12516 [Temnothorax longispinosus]
MRIWLLPSDYGSCNFMCFHLNTACDSWISTNKRPITIYDIPSILATALPRATTPENITAGFRATGIYPLDPEIFTDADFMPSYVTDRPAPSAPPTEPQIDADNNLEIERATTSFSYLLPNLFKRAIGLYVETQMVARPNNFSEYGRQVRFFAPRYSKRNYLRRNVESMWNEIERFNGELDESEYAQRVTPRAQYTFPPSYTAIPFYSIHR